MSLTSGENILTGLVSNRKRLRDRGSRDGLVGEYSRGLKSSKGCLRLYYPPATDYTGTSEGRYGVET